MSEGSERIYVSASFRSGTLEVPRPEGESTGLDAHNLVLVADDEDDMREVLVDLLEDEGWTVLEAADGREALEKALDRRPAVLVLDHRMPGLEGADVLRRLTAEGVRIPVVFITAAHDIAALAESVGVSCFLGKPFGVEDLLSAVRRAAEERC